MARARPVSDSAGAAALIAAAACVLVAVLAALPYVSMSGYGAAPDGTANLEARSLYVQGRFFLNKRTEKGCVERSSISSRRFAAIQSSPPHTPASRTPTT